TNLSVFVPAEGVLYCGDCIVDRFIPNLEEGKLSDWETWRTSLAKIENIAPRIVIPGHGAVISERSNIKREIARIKKILDKAIKTGIAPTLE
ncbi:MAG TPA: hypothetical protein VHY08_14620, partial [Bacillota bacterium]|nr:hypothetical protein [Bacillota bacterium]